MCSLRFRILGSYFTIIAVVLILVNTTPVMTTQRLIVESKSNELLKTANMVSSTLAGLGSLDSERVESVMSILDVSGDVRVLVTDYRGAVLYDNSRELPVRGKTLMLSEVFSALSGNDSFRSTYTDGAFESIAAVPVMYKGEILGTVCFFDVDAGTAGLLLGIQDYLRTITLIVLLVCIVMMILFSAVFSRRMQKLSGAIKMIREGQYEHRLVIDGHDEITALAEEFNDLSGRLQKTETLRRRFVSDASHELKTPLASVKLLADSIIQTPDMPMSDVQEFLHDISDEIARLTRITDHLLQLTRLDVELADHAREYLDLSDIARRAVRLSQPLAAERGITLQADTAPECIVEAAEDPLYQVIFNLVENAIKYNVDCGSVHVLTYKSEGNVYCLVDDTGVGVPEAELSRIFERFYRVDKARSRETGGTGLGLSIVKQTVEEYGGKVWAENRRPQGTRFVVCLPYRGAEVGLES
ncbi:MAG: HAMP domain-containing sensor histidine kinase [Clostridiaceae bacterium]|nr:HAMP domain-containing sensor histidine kinase [Clostridiaceae bacterium]MDY3072356.1 HAMP domain-containing sensor histidine kinase [Eubacteriales bacterium]